MQITNVLDRSTQDEDAKLNLGKKYGMAYFLAKYAVIRETETLT